MKVSVFEEAGAANIIHIVNPRYLLRRVANPQRANSILNAGNAPPE